MYSMSSMALSFTIALVLTSLLLLLIPSHTIGQNFRISTNALAQTSDGAANTFEMDGQISSLVLGMRPNTKTIDMTTVSKFILSGDWKMNIDKGKLTDFRGKLLYWSCKWS
jgi:hypothetical protein